MRRVSREQQFEPCGSAAVKSASLLSVSQPLDFAVWRVCPDDARKPLRRAVVKEDEHRPGSEGRRL